MLITGQKNSCLAHSAIAGIIAMGLFVGSTACHDLTGATDLPAGITDPSTFNTRAGALQLYNAAIYGGFLPRSTTTGSEGDNVGGPIVGGFLEYMFASGILSDELQPGTLGGTPPKYISSIPVKDFQEDARQMPECMSETACVPDPSGIAAPLYSDLQKVRANANLALGALASYGNTVDAPLRGHMSALQGYSEILLAELFCSGIPLSTLDYQGDFTYQHGSTTTEVFQHAIKLLDSAVALSGDSTRIENLARVGLGRAYVDLGEYENAAQVVSSVPDDFAYQFMVDWKQQVNSRPLFQGFNVTVSDGEGTTGIPYISSSDPRSAVVPDSAFKKGSIYGQNQFGVDVYFPRKYGSPNAESPITVADGVEARLIQAEAALHAGNISEWLTMLAQARSDLPPTLTAGLPSLVDPGSEEGRVNLLFRERAFDLFLTGHRQGDMRRLIRQYGRDPETVYPTGVYPSVPNTLPLLVPMYGTDVTVPIPAEERRNPLFSGCRDRSA